MERNHKKQLTKRVVDVKQPLSHHWPDETALLTPSGEGDSKATAPDKIGVRHVIIVSPARHRNKRAQPDVYDVWMKGQGRIVYSSRQPFLDAARAMLDGGLATPQDWLIMRRVNSGADCLSASVAEAAKLSVEERRNGRGPVFVPWKPFVNADLDAAKDELTRMIAAE